MGTGKGRNANGTDPGGDAEIKAKVTTKEGKHMSNVYGQDVDKIVENWSARLWEELNADDPKYNNWYPAISKMQEAVSLLYQASSSLEKATEWTEGTWAEYRIASLAEEIDRIASEVNGQVGAMERA